jgi:hypothetical protein
MGRNSELALAIGLAFGRSRMMCGLTTVLATGDTWSSFQKMLGSVVPALAPSYAMSMWSPDETQYPDTD